MNLNYENNFEDLVALAEHGLSIHADYQKHRRWSLYGGPLLILILGVGVALDNGRPVIGMAGAAGAVIAFFGILLAHRTFPRRAMKKFLREKPQQGALCLHTVTISPEGFTDETPDSRHFHHWEDFSRIAFTPDHIFLYTTPVAAYIIPRRELGDAQFQLAGDVIRKSGGSGEKSC